MKRYDIKVPDSEGNSLANTKIDDIRNGFSEWADAQSPEFKDRLRGFCIQHNSTATSGLYNERIRHSPPDTQYVNWWGPLWNGSNIIFGKKKTFGIWMLKQNGGAICRTMRSHTRKGYR